MSIERPLIRVNPSLLHQQVLVFPCIESVLAVTLPPQREEG